MIKLHDAIENLQIALNDNGANPQLKEDGVWGDLTSKEINRQAISSRTAPVIVVSDFHPTFKIPSGCTDLHPYDIARHFNGTREIPGRVDNPLIAYMHQFSKDVDKRDWHDDVPWCSSFMNWIGSLAHCRITGSGMASSWDHYNNERQGDWVEIGDLCAIAHPGRHITMAAERFNRKTAKTFTGFGGNQTDQVKPSPYYVRDIRKVQIWQPLPGVILAPIGSPAIIGTGTLTDSTT